VPERGNLLLAEGGTGRVEQWRVQYNEVRPHSSLGYRPPAPKAILPKQPGHGDVENAMRFPHPHTPGGDYGQTSNEALPLTIYLYKIPAVSFSLDDRIRKVRIARVRTSTAVQKANSSVEARSLCIVSVFISDLQLFLYLLNSLVWATGTRTVRQHRPHPRPRAVSLFQIANLQTLACVKICTATTAFIMRLLIVQRRNVELPPR